MVVVDLLLVVEEGECYLFTYYSCMGYKYFMCTRARGRMGIVFYRGVFCVCFIIIIDWDEIIEIHLVSGRIVCIRKSSCLVLNIMSAAFISWGVSYRSGIEARPNGSGMLCK